MEKRILFLTDSFGGGGVERNLTHLLRKWNGNGYQMSVRSFFFTQNVHEFPEGTVRTPILQFAKKLPQTKMASRYVKALAAILSLPSFFQKDKTSYESLFRFLDNYHRSCRALKEIIRSEKPDLILTFRRHSALIALLTRFLYRLELPIVCSHRSHLSLRVHAMPTPRVFRFLARTFYNHADFHIAVSNGVRNDIVNNFRVSPDKITTIYNGVDIDSVRADAVKIIEEEPYRRILNGTGTPAIMSIGRLTVGKGHDYLLRAFQKVVSKMNCYLFIAGDGPDRNKLHQLSLQLQIDQFVFFLGWRKNPFAFLNRCELFVSSSLSDGFSNVLLEAMACGLPIIATDCNFGPSELLENGKHGILVPVKNEDALASAILNVLGDRQLRMQLQLRSKERIQSFTLQKMLNQYEYLFCHAGKNGSGGKVRMLSCR